MTPNTQPTGFSKIKKGRTSRPLGWLLLLCLAAGSLVGMRSGTAAQPADISLMAPIVSAKPRPVAPTAVFPPTDPAPQPASSPPATPLPPSAEPPPPLPLGVVQADANLRAGPGLAYGVLMIVARGTEAEFLGQQSGWLWVEIGSGERGWLQTAVLSHDPAFDLVSLPLAVPDSLPTSRSLSGFDALVVRPTSVYAGPGLDQPLLVAQLPLNSPVNLAGRDPLGVWVLLEDQLGSAGWVLASGLQFAPGLEISALPDLTTPPVPRERPFDPRSNVFEWGGQSHDIARAPEMQALGMQWIKAQSKYHPHSKPEDVAGWIAQAHERGFKILLAMPGEPYPESIDFEHYVDFLAGVAALEDPPDAIEVWNEMNIDFEWPRGQIDPQMYVERMLKPAYLAIKAANPDIMVISGAPAPTGFTDGIHAMADDRYIMGMLQAGARDYLDCVGVHYNSGATSPYATSGHPAGGFYGWYFKPMLTTYFNTFVNKPLCITEIGYLSGDDMADFGYQLPANFWWAQETSVEEHARWLAEARQLSQELGFVRLFIVFNVDIAHWDGRDPQAGYAMFRPLGNCPACEAFAGGAQ